MKALHKKIQIASRGLSTDWPIATFCFFLGVICLQTSMRSKSWKTWVAKEINQVPLIQVEASRGKQSDLGQEIEQKSVRLRKNGHLAWQDSPLPLNLAEGDEILTGSQTEIDLKTPDHPNLRMFKNSDLIFHANLHPPSPPKVLINTLETFHALLFGHTAPIATSFELKSGQFEIHLPSGETPQIHKMELFLDSTEPLDPIHRKVKWIISAANSHLEILQTTLVNESEAPLSPHNEAVPALLSSNVQPMIPKILKPISGARFASSANEREEITLQWEPIHEPLKPEIEIRRIDDPDFNVHLTPTSIGTVASLPDGQYSWRIRTLMPNPRSMNSKKRELQPLASEWSPSQEFTIQENIIGTTPHVARTLSKLMTLEKQNAEFNSEGNHSDKRLKSNTERSIKQFDQKQKSKPSSVARKLASLNKGPQLHISKYQSIVDAAQKRIKDFEIKYILKTKILEQ